MPMPKNRLFVISSPSGAGKSTLIRHIRGVCPKIHFSVSCTTRAPRHGEQAGRDYHFISKAEFERKITANAFIEHEKVYDHYYGTLKSEVEHACEKERAVILEIDVKGARRIKILYPDAVRIFIDLSDMNEYKKRLTERGSETPETMRRRLREIENERRHKTDFDHVIVNDDLKAAKAEMEKIFKRYLTEQASTPRI